MDRLGRRTESGEDGVYKLVLDGIGITYIEATDPINFKLYQFDISQNIYLFMAPSPSDALRSVHTTFEGLEMDYLELRWTRAIH